MNCLLKALYQSHTFCVTSLKPTKSSEILHWNEKQSAHVICLVFDDVVDRGHDRIVWVLSGVARYNLNSNKILLGTILIQSSKFSLVLLFLINFGISNFNKTLFFNYIFRITFTQITLLYCHAVFYICCDKEESIEKTQMLSIIMQ